MKVKEVYRTANVAWSPASQHPAYLAAGTPAQQLDATFSTTASLDIYTLDLSDSALEMPKAASIQMEERCCKLVWGCHEEADSGGDCEVAGVLVAGTDNGNLCIYNPSKLLEGTDALVATRDNHVGCVRALDFNKFQTNLLATGAGESDILIWDLNKMDTPMTPGTKSQPAEDVICLAWNQKVQHILASTFANRCVVWDLRKSDPVIKLSDSMTKMKLKQVCWHPDVATRLCVSSEDDHTPEIQMWDLRCAASPVQTLRRHTKGILSMAWCPRDPDLLLSSGKDNLLFCWNPNSNHRDGELVYEAHLENRWVFDVAWCPRNPSLISAAAFDDHVTVYSLMGGRGIAHGPPKRVAESFPVSDDPFAEVSQAQAEAQAQAVADSHQEVMPALRRPPKWLKSTCGARFAFGGRLVSFTNPPSSGSVSESVNRSLVHVSQVVTERDLVERADSLDSVLANNQLAEWCTAKVDSHPGRPDEMECTVWKFLRAHFEDDTREAFMDLLGFGGDFVKRRIASAMKIGKDSANASEFRSRDEGEGATEDEDEGEGGSTGRGEDNESGHPSDQGQNDSFDIDFGDHNLGSQLQLSVVEDGVDSALSLALLTGDLDRAVDLCLRDDRTGEAVILAVASGREDLYKKTQTRVFSKLHSDSSRLIRAVVTRDWVRMMDACLIENWKEALACALTYADAEHFPELCERIGTRLESERNGELALNACLCYICSGNVEKLVHCWMKNRKLSNAEELQSLVEKVVVLRKALDDYNSPPNNQPSSASLLSRYASLLAGQGRLTTALHYLGDSTDDDLLLLRDRIFWGLSECPAGVQQPPFPFKTQHLPGIPRQHAAQPAQTTYSQHQPTQRTRTVSSSSSGPAASTPTYFQPAPPQPIPQRQPPYYPSGGGNFERDNYMAGYPPTNQPRYEPNYPTQPVSSQPSGYYPPPMQGQQAPFSQATNPALAPPVMARPRQASPGWNDPPIVSHAYQADPVEPPREPIVHNFYNPAAHMPDPSAPPGGPPVQPSGGMFQPPQPSGSFPPPMSSGGSAFNPAVMPPPHQQQQQQPVVTQTRPAANGGQMPPEQSKAALPVDHQVIQDVLGSLVNSCRLAGNNRQMKMKMDDVDRKLEFLYSLLSSGNLSPTVVDGLHQIVGVAREGDYNTALAHINNIIQQANFAEIRTFMPALKMLMQSALHTLRAGH